MRSNYVLYSSIWCRLEEIRDCIKKSRILFKRLIEYIKDYNDLEGITFLELTEDSLKNLPALMVDSMKCFSQENIDTMVFNTKEIRCSEEQVESLRSVFDEILSKLRSYGFKAEVVIVREVKIEEENIGKTVGKKDYEIYYYKQF